MYNIYSKSMSESQGIDGNKWCVQSCHCESQDIKHVKRETKIYEP